MSGAFEMAWTLLKNMQPFVPTSEKQKIGEGTYRTAFRSPTVPHVTKFGSGEGLANALLLQRLARMYPEYFEAEELHAAPEGTPDFVVNTKDKQGLRWNDVYRDTDRDGMKVNPRNIVSFTQRRGDPLESNVDWDAPSRHMSLRNRMYDEMPITQAMRMWDVKPQNWAEYDDSGVEVPEYDGRKVKIIDPQFNLRGAATAHTQRPFYTDDFMEASREFQSDLPTLEEFAKPIIDSAYNTGDERVIAPMEDLLGYEQRQLNESLDWMNP